MDVATFKQLVDLIHNVSSEINKKIKLLHFFPESFMIMMILSECLGSSYLLAQYMQKEIILRNPGNGRFLASDYSHGVVYNKVTTLGYLDCPCISHSDPLYSECLLW